MDRGFTYGGIPTVPTEFASFEFYDGKAVEVSLRYAGTPVNEVNVRRLDAYVPARHVGSDVRFLADRPGIYEIEVNHDLRNRGPLILAVNSREHWTPRPGDISFPPGALTNAGVIRITKDNQRIHIPAGAVVRALFKIAGASNVTISGHGLLLFDAMALRQFSQESDSSPILMTDAHNVTLDGITVIVAPNSFSSGPDGTPLAPWAVHVLRSSDIFLENVNILNQLRDGLDIDGSRRVTVRGGLVQAHDDALCVKATNYGPGGGGENQSVESLTFENIMLSNTGAGAAIAIGTELHTDKVSDIIYRNIDILHALPTHGTAVSLRNGDRARVRNILFDHINMLDRPGTLFKFSVEIDAYKPDSERGSIDGVTFRDFSIRQADIATSEVNGLTDNHTISDLTFIGVPEELRRRLKTKNAPAPRWLQR